MKAVKQALSWIMNASFLKKGRDVVEETSEESFPASDPPSWAGSEQCKTVAATPHNSAQTPIAILKEEHRAIMKVIYLMHEQVENLQQQRPLELDLLKKIIVFMRTFVESNHHQKEVQYLFPALEESKAPLAECRLGFFEEEHQASVHLVNRLDTLLNQFKANQSAASEKLIETLNDLKDIYTRHTLKEENFVFPLAEKYLSANTQKTLTAQFEKIDRLSDYVSLPH